MPQSREELVSQLFENMDAMKRGMYSYFHALQKDFPVSRTQLELLTTISHLQPVSFKDLAQRLYLTPGAISQLVDGLATQSLILREQDPLDRRIQALRLSKKGNKLLQTLEKRRHTIMERVIQDLTTDELVAWLHVQQKMIAHFRADMRAKQTKEDS